MSRHDQRPDDWIFLCVLCQENHAPTGRVLCPACRSDFDHLSKGDAR